MPIKDAYRQKFEAQIEELNARLALGRAQAKKLAADARIAAHEELAETENKLAEMKKKFADLGKAGEGALKDLKIGVKRAGRDLTKAAKRARARLG